MTLPIRYVSPAGSREGKHATCGIHQLKFSYLFKNIERKLRRAENNSGSKDIRSVKQETVSCYIDMKIVILLI